MATGVSEILKKAVREVDNFPEPGVSFKDLTPLLQDDKLYKMTLRLMMSKVSNLDFNKVAGVEARGFMIGGYIAAKRDAGFIPIRKAGKLPHTTYSEAYSLEYGKDNLEIHTDAVKKGDKVLIHDDVLATGGTLEATIKLIQKAGAEVVGVCLICELTFLNGRDKIPAGIEVVSLFSY